MNHARVPTPVAELVTHKHVNGATPANDDNIFAAGRQLTSEAEEPTVFMIISG